MFDLTRITLFLTAALLLAIAPGPGMLYVLARSLAGGKREGVLSALGTFLGGMVHVFAAALGLSIILAKSAVAFAAVKYLGAAYLCFLGLRMILDARRDNANAEPLLAAGRPARNPLWQGVATEVLNPKTALFFLSFIPQFVNHASGHIFLQFVVLGTHFRDPEYHGRPDRHPYGRAAGRAHSLLRCFPAAAAHRDRGHHDWIGNLPGDERQQVDLGAPKPQKIWDCRNRERSRRWHQVLRRRDLQL
jgi:threonine/homoserine/homoserine lactone efflux protein